MLPPPPLSRPPPACLHEEVPQHGCPQQRHERRHGRLCGLGLPGCRSSCGSPPCDPSGPPAVAHLVHDKGQHRRRGGRHCPGAAGLGREQDRRCERRLLEDVWVCVEARDTCATPRRAHELEEGQQVDATGLWGAGGASTRGGGGWAPSAWAHGRILTSAPGLTKRRARAAGSNETKSYASVSAYWRMRTSVILTSTLISARGNSRASSSVASNSVNAA